MIKMNALWIGVLTAGAVAGGCGDLRHGAVGSTGNDASMAPMMYPDSPDAAVASNDDAGDPGPDPQNSDPTAPPPITGGTLIVTADGLTAVASDPDRDLIYIIDLTKKSLAASLPLNANDEPGRLVEASPGMVYVVLRRSGAVVSVDTKQKSITDRRTVCPAPRGIAWDAGNKQLAVACAGGELLSMPEKGSISRRLVLDRDLRDVVVDGSNLLVSRLRSAEMLVIASDGSVSQRMSPPQFSSQSVRTGSIFMADSAWRLNHLNGGGAVMLHQRALTTEVKTMQQGGYGVPPQPAQCASSLIHVTLSTLRPGQGIPQSGVLQAAVVPVDFALSPDNSNVAIVSAGAVGGNPKIINVALNQFARGDCVPTSLPKQPAGQPTAVAYVPNGDLLVQTREPAALYFPGTDTTLSLSALSRTDSGHEIFHHDSGGGIACASCHPEGGDDGRVWNFDIGPRRTQSLRGGVLGTEPYHWAGDMPDFAHLVDDVFTKRMGGGQLSAKQQLQVSLWVDSIPLVPATAPTNVGAVGRGRDLFESPYVGCINCHTGPKLTNNMTVNVGTGGMFQVPTLRGVVARAPYMHTGCAATLRDRFNGGCGGGDMHGTTSSLTANQIDDLVAYLETL